MREGNRMIYGTGIDIVEIGRVEKAMKNPHFLTRFFSPDEIRFFEEKNFAPASVAANFACKEAFSKAIGTGIRNFALNEVEILRDELGKPHISLSGDAKKLTDSLGITGLFVSISHSKRYAVANVISER